MSTHSILVDTLDEYLETHTPTVCVLVKMDEGQGPGRKRQAIDACTRIGTLRDTSTTNPHPNPNLTLTPTITLTPTLTLSPILILKPSVALAL